MKYSLVGEMKLDSTSKATPRERTITFVASDATTDRAEEIVKIDTFNLPTKDGGLIKVAALDAGNNAAIDVPLLTDHDGFSVDKVIGSVRKAEYRDDKLVFTAGVSSRKYAQDLLLLLTEGHLHNAFSIGWRGGTFDPQTKSYENGEIIEVSLVTRGCNRDASLIDVKNNNALQSEDLASEKGKDMGEALRANEEAAAEAKLLETAKEAEDKQEAEIPQDAATEEPATPPAQNDTNVSRAKDNATNVSQNEANTAETKTGEAGVAKSTENDTNVAETESNETNVSQVNNNQGEQEMGKTIEPTHKKIAVSQVQAPTQKVAVVSNAKAWLDTAEANHEFAKFIVENYGKSNAAVLKAWAEKMATKGITGDAILPTTIEQTFFKVWQNESGILAFLKPSRLLQGSAYAVTTGSRGLGHKKGEKKDDASFETIRRDYKAKIAYARMPIDLQDLIDDTTGELTILRADLLADILYTEVARAVLIGDGRDEQDEELNNHDHRLFDGTRGIWSMVADLDNSGKSSNQTEKYASAVATAIENAEADTPFDKAIKVLSALRGRTEKILVAPTGYLASLMLSKDNTGRYIFNPGSDFGKLLTARVFEFDFMAEAKYDLIAFNASQYLFPTGADMLRTAFDTEYNTDIMLHEKPVTGTLFGRKTCAGYKQASEAVSLQNGPAVATTKQAEKQSSDKAEAPAEASANADAKGSK